jgi:hypothetical protein
MSRPACPFPRDLRHLERSDAPAWYACLADPVVIEHTSWDLRSARPASQFR